MLNKVIGSMVILIAGLGFSDCGNNLNNNKSPFESITPNGDGITINHTNYDPTSLSNDEIIVAASLDVYFEHASVGGYIVGPLSDWQSNGLEALNTENSRYSCGRETWYENFTASWYDTNNGMGDNSRGNPDGMEKISGFSTSLNTESGLLAGKVDVAMFKFCYIDAPNATGTAWDNSFTASELFNAQRVAMEQLQSDYPNVVFVWWTMPIETAGETGRQEFNNLVRDYCASYDQWLFDVAAIESHNDSGDLQTDISNRELLYSGYTEDGGHPNAAGTLKLAKAYWRLLGEISKNSQLK